ncbi:AraC family transcriptional regulator [Microbacter sp. GSS18]|nr:AraC family transcriptional regulator [Microbacter sp. GSS18]
MAPAAPVSREAGFTGPRHIVIPLGPVRAALDAPITRRLVVTACGRYPSTTRHRSERPRGADEDIVIMCADGRGWVEVDGARHDVGPRDVLVLPRRVPHAYGADDDDPWTISWLHLGGGDLREHFDACGVSVSRPVVPIRSLSLCLALTEGIIDRLEHDRTLASLTATSGAVVHILATIASERRRDARDAPVQRIKEALATDLGDSLTLLELSARVNLSVSYLSELFKTETGRSPMQYRTYLRMRRARALLGGTDEPIAAIAAKVGYPDPAHFSKRFTAVHGQSPRAYRLDNT